MPRGSAGSGANIPFLVQLWPPSDLGVKLQSSPTSMIIFISLLCAAVSGSRLSSPLNGSCWDFLTRTQIFCNLIPQTLPACPDLGKRSVWYV